MIQFVINGKSHKESKCWTCHYAYNKERECCWADYLEPRSDWTAIETYSPSSGTSFYVAECPGYISDKEWEEQNK